MGLICEVIEVIQNFSELWSRGVSRKSGHCSWIQPIFLVSKTWFLAAKIFKMQPSFTEGWFFLYHSQQWSGLKNPSRKQKKHLSKNFCLVVIVDKARDQQKAWGANCSEGNCILRLNPKPSTKRRWRIHSSVRPKSSCTSRATSDVSRMKWMFSYPQRLNTETTETCNNISAKQEVPVWEDHPQPMALHCRWTPATLRFTITPCRGWSHGKTEKKNHVHAVFQRTSRKMWTPLGWDTDMMLIVHPCHDLRALFSILLGWVNDMFRCSGGAADRCWCLQGLDICGSQHASGLESAVLCELL